MQGIQQKVHVVQVVQLVQQVEVGLVGGTLEQLRQVRVWNVFPKSKTLSSGNGGSAGRRHATGPFYGVVAAARASLRPRNPVLMSECILLP